MANFGAKIQYSGDWEKLEKFLKYNWRNDLFQELDKATKRSALYVLSEIRKRIHDREYTPNKLSTALKKGFTSVKESTPLVDSGTLIRKALAIEAIGELAYEVGVVKDVPTGDGRSTMLDIVYILHEGGTTTIKRGGKNVIVRIPPRPFLRAVFEDVFIQKYIQRQWEAAIRKVMKKHGAL